MTVGDTLLELFTATVPMPWSMSAEVAFVVVQVSVEDSPEDMLDGMAEMATVGSGFTVTVTF